MQRWVLLTVGLVASVAGACGDDDGGFTFRDATAPPPQDGAPPPPADGGSGGPLRIDPADHEDTIREGAPVQVDYHAYLRGPDGTERDVTAETTWSSSVVGLGTFDGARFTSATDRGGRTIIGARYAAVNATTTLTLRLERIVVTTSAPADAPALFEGAAAPGGGPELVYPADGVVVPPNLRELEVHYRPGAFSVFELRFRAPDLDLKIYLGCPEALPLGCAYLPDEDVWETLSTAARGAGPIEVDLRGTDGSGGPVGAAPTRQMTIVEEEITGGLYYWNAAGGTINRFEFGRRGARPEVFIDQPRSGAGVCVGCHALARDGSRIAVGLDIPGQGFQAYDVATRARLFDLRSFLGQPTFFGLSPDGSQIVSGGGRALDIRDAASGMVTLPNVAANGAMPDWSPDGMRIVYARTDVAPPIDGPSISSGSIALLEWDGAMWREGTVLVPRAGDNNYYPAFSPDGEWVVYNRSPSNTGSMGGGEGMGGVADAELWVIALDGTRVLRLEQAGGLADSWPKWDPTVYRSGGQTVFWLSWSSQRGFGLRYGEGARTQIWMAAFSPTEARANHDPAAPAFRLPFQDLNSGNHIAQWVTSVERMTCTSDDECGGEFCIDGVCVPDFI